MMRINNLYIINIHFNIMICNTYFIQMFNLYHLNNSTV